MFSTEFTGNNENIDIKPKYEIDMAVLYKARNGLDDLIDEIRDVFSKTEERDKIICDIQAVRIKLLHITEDLCSQDIHRLVFYEFEGVSNSTSLMKYDIGDADEIISCETCAFCFSSSIDTPCHKCVGCNRYEKSYSEVGTDD